jgi:acyl-CoA thioester hydrolase
MVWLFPPRCTSQKGAFVSLQNSRPIPIPEELKNKYLEYQKQNLKDYL